MPGWKDSRSSACIIHFVAPANAGPSGLKCVWIRNRNLPDFASTSSSQRLCHALGASVTGTFIDRFSSHARIGGVTIAVSSDIATMIAYI